MRVLSISKDLLIFGFSWPKSSTQQIGDPCHSGLDLDEGSRAPHQEFLEATEHQKADFSGRRNKWIGFCFSVMAQQGTILDMGDMNNMYCRHAWNPEFNVHFNMRKLCGPDLTNKQDPSSMNPPSYSLQQCVRCPSRTGAPNMSFSRNCILKPRHRYCLEEPTH